MAVSLVKLRPGIDTELSPVLNEAGFSASQQIRFFQRLPQKRGGWSRLSSTPLTGTCRGMWAWADLSGNPYIAAGTEQRLAVAAFGEIFDITPYRQTSNITPAFATTSGSPDVTVTDTGFGGSAGDWVLLPVPVAIGGLVLQGFLQIQSVTDSNDYVVTASSNATETISGGAVPSFTTTSGSGNVEVTLDNHGLAAGDLWGVQVATTVGGITIAVGTYPVLSSPAPTANTFYIAPGTAATSSTTASENGGNVEIDYLYPTGYASATLLAGYGAGNYGSGDYGGSDSTGSSLFALLRQWFLGNWGGDLIGNCTRSPVFVWTPPVSTIPGTPAASPALAINTTNYPSAKQPPTIVNMSFVAMPQEMLICCGVDVYGTGELDPLMIRWCDIADFTDWEALATNQAGSFRLPNGSRLMAGIQGPLFWAVWTDLDMWLAEYLGFPLVWGINKVEGNKGLISARAADVAGPLVYFAARDSFNVFDGSAVRTIPCPVWNQFFANLNWQQVDKVHCISNSFFNEVSWFYPSANSVEVDSRVTYHIDDDVWSYDGPGMQGAHTSALDVSFAGLQQVAAVPYFTDTAGLIQQEETGYDADGQQLVSSITTGYMTASEGMIFSLLRRLYPDFISVVPTGTAVQISILLKDYPTDDPTVVGPFNWQPGANLTPYITVMKRARLFALQISSTGFGVFWRLGGFRYDAGTAGAL